MINKKDEIKPINQGGMVEALVGQESQSPKKNMPKCPKCGKEIYHLLNIREEIAKYVLSYDGGEKRYFFADSWQGDWSVFKCPRCHEDLFDNEEDAIKFLDGEVIKE